MVLRAEGRPELGKRAQGRVVAPRDGEVGRRVAAAALLFSRRGGALALEEHANQFQVAWDEVRRAQQSGSKCS